jgi:hypothetical protein
VGSEQDANSNPSGALGVGRIFGQHAFALLEYRHRSHEFHFSFATSKEAREDGSFRFVLDPGSVLSLTARDPAERFNPATEEEVETGTSDLVLALVHQSRALRGSGAASSPISSEARPR